MQGLMLVDKNHSHSLEAPRIALVGTYLPRQCGIGTFTKDLRDSLDTHPRTRDTLVLALDDISGGYAYPEEVRFQIRAFHQEDYRRAAELLNINQVDVAIIQHEFGIFGGADGSYILDLAAHLRMPVVTTLHTVLMKPSPGQAKIILELAKYSDRLVVMSHKAVRMLQEVYEVPRKKIAFIPHGIPDVPFVDPVFHKDQFGLEERQVLLTFGLLSPGKGIEVALRALPGIIDRHPEAVYLVLGATHPHVLRKEGDAYRHQLERLAEKLGVREHVIFHNRFVTIEELCGYIGAADVYITPYLNEAQITSGTLAYAMGAGKAVISTPYWYAEEMLAEGRGRLFPFGDSEALREAVNALLDDPRERNAMRKRAYLFCRDMVWQEVGARYVELAAEIIEARHEKPRPSFFLGTPRIAGDSLPEIKLDHLRMLTDDTGVLQHATCTVPNRGHGYCTDDNARALIAMLIYRRLYEDDSVLSLINRYLSFIDSAFDDKQGTFRNFMGYDRRWFEQGYSEDANGRAVWALGTATLLAPNVAYRTFAAMLLNRSLDGLSSMTSPRAWAFALLGLNQYIQVFDGDTRVRRARDFLADRLYELFAQNATRDWMWYENLLSYSNALLPHAMIQTGLMTDDESKLAAGLEPLEWLIGLVMRSDGVVSLLGNKHPYERGGPRPRFDQQPEDAMCLVRACAEAYRYTEDLHWYERARKVFLWFLGNNDTQSVMYDYETGGCRDGLHPDGPSLNEGAESTLAWLISLLTIADLSSAKAYKPAPVSAPRLFAEKGDTVTSPVGRSE